MKVNWHKTQDIDFLKIWNIIQKNLWYEY